MRTPFTMICNPGAVVLVRFPFTDMTSVKKRPSIVLSSAEYTLRYNDIVILALTSKRQSDDSLFLTGWREAGLVKETWIKPLIGTVSQDLITRELGAIRSGDYEQVKKAISLILDDSFRDNVSTKNSFEQNF